MTPLAKNLMLFLASCPVWRKAMGRMKLIRGYTQLGISQAEIAAALSLNIDIKKMTDKATRKPDGDMRLPIPREWHKQFRNALKSALQDSRHG